MFKHLAYEMLPSLGLAGTVEAVFSPCQPSGPENHLHLLCPEKNQTELATAYLKPRADG